MSDTERTTVPCTPATRDKLKDLGKKGETYDSILNRLIDVYNEHSSMFQIGMMSAIGKEETDA